MSCFMADCRCEARQHDMLPIPKQEKGQQGKKQVINGHTASAERKSHGASLEDGSGSEGAEETEKRFQD